MENIFMITSLKDESQYQTLIRRSKRDRYTSMKDAIKDLDFRYSNCILVGTPDGNLVESICLTDDFAEGLEALRRLNEYLHLEGCNALDHMMKRIDFEISLCGGHVIDLQEYFCSFDFFSGDFCEAEGYEFMIRPALKEARDLLRKVE